MNAIVSRAGVIQTFGDYYNEILGRTPHSLCDQGRFAPGVIHGSVLLQKAVVPDYFPNPYHMQVCYLQEVTDAKSPCLGPALEFLG